MKFIKKKNFREGEELLYTPQLHWFYTIKPLVFSLPFFLALLVLWAKSNSPVSAPTQLGLAAALSSKILIRQVFLAGILVLLVIFLCRILQYLNTEYGVTNKWLMLKKGVLRMTVAEIPVDRIESIYCMQGIFGKLFRYGTICVSGIGGKTPVFYMVARPLALRRKIVEIMEKNKRITVVHGDIPKPKSAARLESAAEQEPVYRYGTFVRVLPHSGK